MPILGRSTVNEGWPRTRWGSRVFTKAYVETHIRKQLQAIRDCLRLQLMGATEDEAMGIAELEGKLAPHVEPLFRWRRLGWLLARLPPVVAALPIISAASQWPLGDDVSARTVFNALLVLASTAIVVWLLVVWPSIRLGFRVKRVIFAGGSDIRRPVTNPTSKVRWEGFPESRPGKGPKPFPKINAYQREDDVYRALGARRKPAEVPIDMLLGLTPYLWIAYSAFFFWGLIDTIVDGDLGEALSDSGFGLLIAALLALVPLFFPWNARKSYHDRPH